LPPPLERLAGFPHPHSESAGDSLENILGELPASNKATAAPTRLSTPHSVFAKERRVIAKFRPASLDDLEFIKCMKLIHSKPNA